MFIPRELSQDQFPYSFRYYDPIIAFIQENLSDDRREIFNVKHNVAFSIYRENDQKRRLMEFLGMVENGKEKKLTFKHSAVNKKVSKEINHHLSKHTTSLQRSKYICVNDSISKQNVFGAASAKSDGEDNGKQLNLRFCPVDEVNLKR